MNDKLFALVWGNNTCCTTVLPLSEVNDRIVHDAEDDKDWSWGKLIIDETNSTWSQGKKSGKIGEHFTNHGGLWNEYRYGLIGIYDSTNIKHLRSMIHDAHEAVEDRHRCLW